MKRFSAFNKFQSSPPQRLLGGNIFFYALSQRETNALLSQAFELKLRAIDTADIYSDGNSESYIGNYLRSSKNRDKWFIATKIGVKEQRAASGLGNLKIMKSRINNSLKRLGTDYVDLLQLHHIDRSTHAIETFEAVQTLKHAGLIKNFGICNVNLSYLKYLTKLNLLHCLDFVQIYGNWLMMDEFQLIVKYLRNSTVKILGYGMFGRGVLARTSPNVNESLVDLKSRRFLNPVINNEFNNPNLVQLLSNVEVFLKTYKYSLKDLAMAYYLKNNVAPIVACRTNEHLNFLSKVTPVISDDLMKEIESIVRDFFSNNDILTHLGKPHIDEFIENEFN